MAVSTAVKRWTLDELHGLVDDGNKYELIRGDLYVTPAPSNVHQTIIARLAAILVPYVAANRLGHVHQARSVVRHKESEVEPDLFVRGEAPAVTNDWENAPAPILVVEVLSPFTRRRDLEHKRRFYLDDVGIPEYWMADPDARTIRVARAAEVDLVADHTLVWRAPGASEPLTFDLNAIFDK